MQLHLHLQSPDSVDEYNHAQRVLQAFYDLPAGVLTLSSPKLSAEQLQGLRGDWNATKAAGTTILPGYDVLRGQEAEAEAEVEDDVAETPVPAPVATTTAPAEMDPQSPLILYAQPRAQITPADAARAAEALLLQEAASGVVPPRKRRTKAEMAAAKAAEAAIPPGPKASAEALSAALSGNFETAAPASAAPVVAETEPQPQSQSTPLVHTSVLDSLMAAPITPTPAALTTATATEDSGDFTTWDITRLHGHIKALVSSPSHGPSWLKSKVLVPYGVSRISALSEDQARAVAEADFLETACA